MALATTLHHAGGEAGLCPEVGLSGDTGLEVKSKPYKLSSGSVRLWQKCCKKALRCWYDQHSSKIALLGRSEVWQGGGRQGGAELGGGVGPDTGLRSGVGTVADSAIVFYGPSQATEPYIGLLSSVPFNSRCISEGTHWGHQGFTQGKGARPSLPKGSSDTSTGHFGTTIPLGAGDQ